VSFELNAFIAQHRLPAAFAVTAENYFVPLAQWVRRHVVARRGGSFVLGINAAQGAGKSTLACFLADYLRAQYGDNVATLSIDDLYLPKTDRQRLAREVHPLLATRGVPGTHDPELGYATIRKLQELAAGESMPLPRFDKLRDDRLPADEWPVVAGPVDMILFEGWCVGSQAVASHELQVPVNELERKRDSGGEWRRFVNDQLGARYQTLFDLLDALVFLAVPDFDCVRRWRTEQEQRLSAAGDSGCGQGMSDAQVAQFVQYFERISLNNLQVLPQRADVVLRLGREHQPVSAVYRES